MQDLGTARIGSKEGKCVGLDPGATDALKELQIQTNRFAAKVGFPPLAVTGELGRTDMDAIASVLAYTGNATGAVLAKADCTAIAANAISGAATFEADANRLGMPAAVRPTNWGTVAIVVALVVGAWILSGSGHAD